MLPKLLCGSFVLANPRHPVCHSCILQEIVNDQQNIPKKYLRQRYFYTIIRISHALAITSHSVCLLQILSDWLDSSFLPTPSLSTGLSSWYFQLEYRQTLNSKNMLDCFFSTLPSCNKQTSYRSIKMFMCPPPPNVGQICPPKSTYS